VRTPPEVLILEDDPEQLRSLARAVEAARLAPIAAASPRLALSLLDRRQPLLAIVDLDMSRAPVADRRPGPYQVLGRLHERHPNCIPVVYSVHVETIDDQARACLAHPHALFQSKRYGEAGLMERVDGLLNARCGDLAVRGGLVVHLPSGDAATHRVAVSLVAAKRANRSLWLGESDARAARRFEAWLRRHGSPVRVRALGHRHYQLAARGPVAVP
jgi:CheY-like chemotaxis protein